MLERINLEPINPKEVNAYDMHYHTEYSFDSQTPLNDVLKKAKKMGLNIAITDHNVINGNLKAQNNRYKVKVIPSVEITFSNRRDILFYFEKTSELREFYDKEIKPYLRSNSNVTKIDLIEFLNNFDKDDYNALMVMPHPFLMLKKNMYVVLKNKINLVKKFDALEIFNANLSTGRNIKALSWAYQLKKEFTGGSDGHILNMLGNVVTYTHNGDDILDSIREGRNFVGGVSTTITDKASYLEKYLKGQIKNNTNRILNMEKKIGSGIVGHIKNNNITTHLKKIIKR